MRRIKLIVAYDGTNYCGWQVQPNGITVQEVLNQALSDLFAKKIACIGASRTDAGVHALGNVAVFDTDAGGPYRICTQRTASGRYPYSGIIRSAAGLSPAFYRNSQNI